MRMNSNSLQPMRLRSPTMIWAGIALLTLCFFELVDANVFLSASAIFGKDPPPPPPRDNTNVPPEQMSINTSAINVEGSTIAQPPQQPAPPRRGGGIQPWNHTNGDGQEGQEVLTYPQHYQQRRVDTTTDPGWNIPQPPQRYQNNPLAQQSLPPNHQQQQHRQWSTRPSVQSRRPDPTMFRMESLQRDLDDAMHRERELLAELRNRSTAVAELEQRDRLHTHQLDVLTERVLTVEHLAAQERNEYVEAQANCTALAEALAETSNQVEEWKMKCSELLDLKQKNEKRMQEWKLKWKSAAKEAEDLAIRIEEHRLDDGREQRRRKKKRGFFAWLFGFGKDEVEQEDDDDYDALRERARTNLLTALRTERKAVGELESVVATLQQNNTAIVEQVKSRDRIIQELNDRVAVFEEDKVVLKAALKQLQKEMNDETPKLEDALKDIDHLTTQIKKLQADHNKELTAMKKVVEQKQTKLSAAESNLTTIATYVDKLEERLADFTVAKRDIEKREAASKLASARIKKAEIAKEKLLQRVAELEEEQKLLQAQQDKLQNYTATITMERDGLNTTLKAIRETYEQVDDEAKRLRSANDQWEQRFEELESQLNATMEKNQATQVKLNTAETRLSEMQSQMNDVATTRAENDQALSDAASVRNSLQSRITELETRIQQSVTQHKSIIDSLQQKLDAEIRQNIIGKDQRAELVKKLDQMSLRLKNLEQEKKTALEQIEKMKDLQSKPVERIEAPQGTMSASNQSKLNARPPGAAFPPETPAYLPRSADAPKRAFGKGIVNSPNATKVEDVTTDITNATVVSPEPVLLSEDELFPRNSTEPKTNRTLTTRKVPLRGFRKFLSKRTGLHGVITKPSSAGNKRKRGEDMVLPAQKKPSATRVTPKPPQRPIGTQGRPYNNLPQSRPKASSTLPPHR